MNLPAGRAVLCAPRMEKDIFCIRNGAHGVTRPALLRFRGSMRKKIRGSLCSISWKRRRRSPKVETVIPPQPDRCSQSDWGNRARLLVQWSAAFMPLQCGQPFGGRGRGALRKSKRRERRAPPAMEPLNRSSRREEALSGIRKIKFEPPHVGCYEVHGEEENTEF